jgi:hypothetical protein
MKLAVIMAHVSKKEM